MSKLGVGVGDEFPAGEIPPEETVVHHHHYYRRWRRPGGFLRVILWIALIGLVFRGLGYLTHPWHAWRWRGDGGWDSGFPAAGWIVPLLIVGGLLWLLRCTNPRPRR